MKTLLEIKNEVAQKHEYADWFAIENEEGSQAENDSVKASMIDEIAKLYAEEALKEAAERASIRYSSCGDPMTCGCQGTCEYPNSFIDKKSILSLINELK